MRDEPRRYSKSFISRLGRANKDEATLTLEREELLTVQRVNPSRGRGPEEGGVIAIRRYLHMLGANQRGATAIEYALICALIVITMIAGLKTLAGGSVSMWGRILTSISAIM